jgi:hypothetical protein
MVTLSGRKKQRRGNRVSVARGGVDGGAGGGRRSLECRLTPLCSAPLISPELVHLWLCLWHLNSTHRYFPVTGRREREEERERRQSHGRQQPHQKKVDFEITNVSKFQSMEDGKQRHKHYTQSNTRSASSNGNGVNKRNRRHGRQLRQSHRQNSKQWIIRTFLQKSVHSSRKVSIPTDLKKRSLDCGKVSCRFSTMNEAFTISKKIRQLRCM